MNMKLRRLEVFMAVVEQGGFSAAANALHIAQSAVSVTIKELERELGAQLFERSGRVMVLTEAGRLVRERAGPALKQLYSVKDELRDLENLAAGSVRIAAPGMVTHIALRRIVPQFMKRHPGIRLRVMHAGAIEVEELVLRGDADLGLIAWREGMTELANALLWDYPNVACVPARQKLDTKASISWPTLLRLPQAVYPAGYHQRVLVERHAARLGIALRVAVESENPGILMSAVQAGLAVTTLPAPAAEGVAGVRVLRLPQDEGDRLRVGVCWSRQFTPTRATQALLEHLQAGATPPGKPRTR
jgi:DNA-binding transcriptional LysR family regulator